MLFQQATHDISSLVGASTIVPVVGYAANQHPYLAPQNPQYRFRKDLLRPVLATWQQAVTRRPHDPARGLLLTGPSGAGKTSLVCQLFARLNVPVFVFDASRSMDLNDAIRTVGLQDGDTVEQYGGIIQAMTGGYPVLINEFDVLKPEEATVLYSILDNGRCATPDGQVFTAAPGFMVVLTANTNGTGDETGLYAGTRRQSAALTRRVRVIEVGYMDIADEKDVLKKHFPGMTDQALDPILRVMTQVRSAASDPASGILRGISTDEVIAWIQDAAFAAGMERDGLNPFVECLMWNYGNALPADAAASVRTIAEGIFGGAVP